MASKRAGLADHYAITRGHDYFVQHETMDVEHSAAERDLVLAGAEGHEAEIGRAVSQGLEATYTLLDGIHQRYVAGTAA